MAVRILQLTTYPIDHPDHGGKLRSFYIRKALRSTFEVETLSFVMGERDAIDGLQVTLDQDACMKVIGNGYLGDWGINTYLDHRLDFKQQIIDVVRRFNPDVLLLEQPFLWPLAEHLLDHGVVGADTFLIYSSHNNEYVLKEGIYAGIFDGDELRRNLARVAEIECGVATRAHLSFAVTEGDADYLRSMAPHTHVLHYPNGHRGIGEAPAVARWKQKFADYQRNWVFVGSWHPPNIDGLHALATSGVNEMPEGALKIWVFGNAGPGLLATHQLTTVDVPNFSIQGLAETDDINSAIAAATGVVLPVWGGGGSNLKTAQALLSGKAVAGSHYSFRGFEKYKSQAGVFLFESPSELANGLLSIQAGTHYERPAVARELDWEHLLRDLPGKIQHYIENNSTARGLGKS